MSNNTPFKTNPSTGHNGSSPQFKAISGNGGNPNQGVHAHNMRNLDSNGGQIQAQGMSRGATPNNRSRRNSQVTINPTPQIFGEPSHPPSHHA